MSTATTTMGISTNITEIGGSLPYHDHMEYVKGENVEKNLNNGINTVELNFTNTQVKHADNRVAGVHQENLISQIISNTDNNCSKHEEQHQLNNNFHHTAIATIPSHLEAHQTESSSALLSPEPFIYNITDVASSITSVSNITSPTMMWQDDIVDFGTFPDYKFCDVEKMDKFEVEELDHPPHLVHLGRNFNNSALEDCIDNEETFEITHQSDGMILTATQEIIANGISTQDFKAFQNSIFDETAVELTSHNVSDDILSYNEHEIELGADPMIGSINFHQNSFKEYKPENKIEPPESPIDQYDDIQMDMEIDEKAAQQLLSILTCSTNNTRRTDGTNNIISSTPVKKKAQYNLNVVIGPSTSSTATDVDTAQVVDTIFKWENNKTVNEVSQSPLHVSSIPESACNTPSKDQDTKPFFYEDITETSLHSSFDSRYDGSDYGSTAPPTPFSTVSLGTPRSTERKRRGRPPKTHSVEPDPQQLEQLSSSQKRYVMQRYKNNEASRQSRLNRKNKQEQLMDEESRQYTKNLTLKATLQKWEKKHNLLKEMLRQQVKLS